MPEFSTMLSLQAQMMLLLAIGIFLTKKHIITEQGRACLTDLLLFLILPANTIQSFRIEFECGDLPQHAGHPHPVHRAAGVLWRDLRGLL